MERRLPAGGLLVVALGGNALLRRGEAPEIPVQRAHARVAAEALAGLARDYRLVVTHGNGPQVGLLASRAAAAGAEEPLDVAGAESEGLIGYLLGQELLRACRGSEVVSLLTQTVVQADDPAFARPTKPIGLAAGKRKLVPSPEPLAFVEINAIRCLVAIGVLVVCVGGGGIPVTVDSSGAYVGVEAVVDKDLASARLARDLGAHALVLLTDVPGVYRGFGTPEARLLGTVTVTELRALELDRGSMGPKVEAACRFVEAGGLACIGSMDQAADVVAGRAGTQVVPG